MNNIIIIIIIIIIIYTALADGFSLSLSDNKSPLGLFSVFWPFSTVMQFGWSPLVHQLLIPLVHLIIL